MYRWAAWCGVPAIAATALMAAPALAAAGAALPGDIVDASRGVVDSAYRAMAAQLGTDAGIAYRYGPAPADYGSAGNGGVPTWFKRSDTAFVSDQRGGQRPCNPENCGSWQVGSWNNEVGGYSSNVGHVAYVPDNPRLRVGVTDLAISSVSNSVFSQKPELSWTLYGGGLDEINAVAYRKQGKDVSNPVALARCLGRPGAQLGLGATGGGQAAHGSRRHQLGANSRW